MAGRSEHPQLRNFPVQIFLGASENARQLRIMKTLPCSILDRLRVVSGRKVRGKDGAWGNGELPCATLPHERGGVPICSRTVRTALSSSDTPHRENMAVAGAPAGDHGRTSRESERSHLRHVQGIKPAASRCPISGITIALTVAGCVLLIIALLAFVGLFAAGLGLTEHGPGGP
jgi:hypothetical protein